jgi:hypothetical protein
MSKKLSKSLILCSYYLTFVLLLCNSSQGATIKPVILAILPEQVGSELLKPVIAEQGKSYIDLILINVVNHLQYNWFTYGESNYIMGIKFEPFGKSEEPKFTFAQTIDKIPSSGSFGMFQTTPILSKKLFLRLMFEGLYANLSAYIIESSRDSYVIPYLKGLESIIKSVPIPYTATAAIAI